MRDNSITCPRCGEKIPVMVAGGGRLGRKSRDITFTNICKALKLCSRGNPRYTEGARVLEELTGEKVSPAFIWMRVKREADKRGVSREELLKSILEVRDGNSTSKGDQDRGSDSSQG